MGKLEQNASEYNAELKHKAQQKRYERMCDRLVKGGIPKDLAEFYAKLAMYNGETAESVLAMWHLWN